MTNTEPDKSIGPDKKITIGRSGLSSGVYVDGELVCPDLDKLRGRQVLDALKIPYDEVQAAYGRLPELLADVISPEESARREKTARREEFRIATALRGHLEAGLNAAEIDLKIDTNEIRLMPYAVVLGTGTEQRVFPTGINAKYCKRGAADKSSSDLKEYAPNGSGIIVDNELQGAIFPDTGFITDDPLLLASGTIYGRESYAKWKLVTKGDQRYENRPGLSPEVELAVYAAGPPRDPELRSLIPLGLEDDVTGILTGAYKRSDKGFWEKKK